MIIMMFFTHILATGVILKVFAVSDIRIIVLSYVFGVLLDLDHFWTLSKLKKEGKSWKELIKILFNRKIKKRT